MICPRGLTAMTLACRAGNPGPTPGAGVNPIKIHLKESSNLSVLT